MSTAIPMLWFLLVSGMCPGPSIQECSTEIAVYLTQSDCEIGRDALADIPIPLGNSWTPDKPLGKMTSKCVQDWDHSVVPS